MSTVLPPTFMRCGLSRLVPKIVPPSVKIFESASRSRSIVRSCISPRNPSRKPVTFIPKSSIAARPTPRIAAFSPGQSPPEVKIPMCLPLMGCTQV